jgi:hypothetical protein
MVADGYEGEKGKGAKGQKGLAQGMTVTNDRLISY